MYTEEAATTTSGFRGMYFVISTAQQVMVVSTEPLEIEKVRRAKNAVNRRLLQAEQTVLPKINADLN